MVSIKKLIEVAMREARKSQHRHKVGAVIYRRKDVIAASYNEPFRCAKHIKAMYKKYPTSIHAEVSAVLKARKDLTGASIIVVRLNAADELRLAKPCKYCTMYLNHIGIKKVSFSTNDGTMEDLRL